jgi:hypothetical protein
MSTGSTDNPYTRAIAVIKEKGWTQGKLQDEYDDRVCALGALSFALHGDAHGEVGLELHNVLTGIIKEQYPDLTSDWCSICNMDHGNGVAAWNDRDERTEAEVIALFEKAAVRYDEQR